MNQTTIEKAASAFRQKPQVHIGMVGSRKFKELWLVENEVLSIMEIWGKLYELKDIVIVSGGAKGPDSKAVEVAEQRGLGTLVYPVDTLGITSIFEFSQRAYARNTKIAEASEYVVAFWDGRSRGTIDTMRKAKRLAKRVVVVTQDGSHVEWNE